MPKAKNRPEEKLWTSEIESEDKKSKNYILFYHKSTHLHLHHRKRNKNQSVFQKD